MTRTSSTSRRACWSERSPPREPEEVPVVAEDCIVVRGYAGNLVPVPTTLTILSTPQDIIQELEYELVEPAQVDLTVYDVTGRVVKEIVGEEQPAGLHLARWDTRGSPGGMYFCRLRLDAARETRKILLLR